MTAGVVTSPPIDLGRGFSIEFRLEGQRLEAIWSPHVPHGRRGRQLLPGYRAARDAFLADLAAGGNVLVVEV